MGRAAGNRPARIIVRGRKNYDRLRIHGSWSNLKLPAAVIILSGVRNAGKTGTLQQLINLFTPLGRNVYQYKGKAICVYTSSPQEQEEFCHVNDVLDSINTKIVKANENGCRLLILPFSIGRNREGTLNSLCIQKPFEMFRSKGIDPHLIYLRREDARQVTEIDDMMRDVAETTIVSREDYPAQARELLRTVNDVDP
jgi:predicted AAA+ superfamily ATPase